jgi:epoxyqueuosine reductase QueG
MALFPLLTTAELPPDAPIKEDFRHCDDCGLCVETCPGEAREFDGWYPRAYSLIKCVRSREKVLLEEGKLCQGCYAECTAALKSDEEIEKLYDVKRKPPR